jgi:hypothetical protein
MTRLWLTGPKHAYAPRATFMAQPLGCTLCPEQTLLDYLDAKVWCVEQHADGRVRLVHATPWNATANRLFAVECAALVLSEVPPERYEHCATALEVSYRYALGDATEAERESALRAAETVQRVAAGLSALWASWKPGSARQAARHARAASAWPDAMRALQWIMLCRWLEVEPFPNPE